MKKNTAVIVTILAWDTIQNAGKTGLADITLRGVGDGAEYTPVAAASQVDATNLPGVYSVSLTAAENNYNSNCIGGKSATANISIIPFSWINEAEDFTATEKLSLNAATPTVTVGDKTGFELAADQAVNVTKIAGAAVSTSTAQIGVNVVSQDNIDFSALQKASITAAVPDVSAIQSGLALDATVAKAATALSTAVWTNAKAAFLDVAVSSLGTGITSFPAQTYTITIDGVPCADCLVVMTTDIAGSNPIHSGTTDALGQVTFYPNLPAGTTVYLWRFKTGVNFVNPDTEAIS